LNLPSRTTAAVLNATLIACCLGAAWTHAGPAWLTGDRIAIGGDGRGPLSAGLSNYPVGSAFVYGSSSSGRSPDIFVAAGRFSHEPGLFLYCWVGRSAEGAPVFGPRVELKQPGEGKIPPTGTIFQTKNGVNYGFWLIKGAIVRTRFDLEQRAFVPLPLPPVAFEASDGAVNPDNRTPSRFAVSENPDGSLEVVLSVSDNTRFRPPEPPGHRDAAFQPFDGRGIWRGGWPHVYLRAGRLPGPEANVAALQALHDVSNTRREALLSHGGLAFVNLGDGHSRDLLTGSHFGNFYHYLNRAADDGPRLAAQELVRDPAGRVLRSPIISATPIAYPKQGDTRSDLVVGGEGALLYYRFDGLDRDGRAYYRPPLDVLEEKALLYTGSLPVVNSVDWNGDGATDLVVGNSEGKILWYRNRGSNRAPDFARGEPLAAGGETIHAQQGYWGIQGPGEARWGYISPCVVDWNGDGLLDVLSSDASARHTVYLNLGTKTAPRLDVGRALYCDGLELHGTWRVRPAVAKWGSRIAYVALDDDDQFHVYWRIDDFNVSDGGKLKLDDGSAIQASFLSAGGTGRAKITLVDWDADGVMDLIVGTPRHGSVPNPKTGLPQSKGLPGSAVLWLRNVGSNEAPKFAFPLLLHVKGRPAYFGQHECSAAVTELGAVSGRPNLIVGDEEGRVHFFFREEITWSR
jgi:hypothetical protein